MGFFSRIDQILDTLDGTFRRSIERLQHLSTFLTDRILSICHLKNPCFFFLPLSLSLSLLDAPGKRMLAQGEITTNHRGISRSSKMRIPND